MTISEYKEFMNLLKLVDFSDRVEVSNFVIIENQKIDDNLAIRIALGPVRLKPGTDWS